MPLSHIGRSGAGSECTAVDPFDIRVPKVGMRNHHGRFFVTVTHSRVPMADVTMIPKNPRPLGTLERDTVGARKASPDKSNFYTHETDANLL